MMDLIAKAWSAPSCGGMDGKFANPPLSGTRYAGVAIPSSMEGSYRLKWLAGFAMSLHPEGASLPAPAEISLKDVHGVAIQVADSAAARILNDRSPHDGPGALTRHIHPRLSSLPKRHVGKLARNAGLQL